MHAAKKSVALRRAWEAIKRANKKVEYVSLFSFLLPVTVGNDLFRLLILLRVNLGSLTSNVSFLRKLAHVQITSYNKSMTIHFAVPLFSINEQKP